VPFVSASPNEFLLTGSGGKLVNRGSAVRSYLLPGAIYVLVPSTKQEAAIEFTQETKDGIPLRLKGIVIYRITDPMAAARQFDFTKPEIGISQINTMLVHVCLGELRHAVSHMTMNECIEQRKTTLSKVVEDALAATIHQENGIDWGLTVEVGQLAQVFIVDVGLRQQLEAQVRNEIKLKADQSNIKADEETELAQMTSANRVAEQKLASSREELRRREELELTDIARQRRMETEKLETQRSALALEQQRFEAEMAAAEAKVNSEAPVRLLRVAKDAEVLREELAVGELRNQVRASEVEREVLKQRVEQELRRLMLPLEQAPAIAESASHLFQGANLSLYGENAQVLGQLAPLLDVLSRAMSGATASPKTVSEQPAPAAA